MIVENLIITEYGSFVGKHSERLQVTRGGDIVQEAPLLHLRSVLINSRGVSISADAVEVCAERGIPLHFLDSSGRCLASLYSAGLGATILTRRAQLEAANDQRAVHFIHAITSAKIHNQSATIKYMAKNRSDEPDLQQELRLRADEIMDFTAQLDPVSVEEMETFRASVMGIEGSAARLYWNTVRLVLPDDYDWQQRIGRGASDPVNSLLNYGYGILYSQIEQAIILAGLDPYAGFLHADRPGKPSLVLDLIEEFRQIAVDRVVFGLVNRNYDIEQDDHGKLTLECRRGFAAKTLHHLDSLVRYSGKKYPLRGVIQMQARALAGYLRQERPSYEAFRSSW